MMQDMIFCQSCGMPMQKGEDFGTESNGGKSEDYCVYCYQNGSFTADLNLEQMIAYCAEHVDEWGMDLTKDQAIAQMREHFPTLKRWRSV